MKLLSMIFLAAVAIPPSFDSALRGLAASTLLGTSQDKQETRRAEDLFKDALAKAKESKLKVFLTFGSPG